LLSLHANNTSRTTEQQQQQQDSGIQNVSACVCAGEDPSSEIFLYADDSKIYKVIHNQSDQQKLQTILNMIKKTGLTSGFSD